MIILPQKNHVEIRLLERIFSDMTNSYKIYWFSSLFQEVIKGKQRISFKDIVCGMVSEAWYPLLVYYLNFGSQDQLADVVSKLNEK